MKGKVMKYYFKLYLVLLIVFSASISSAYSIDNILKMNTEEQYRLLSKTYEKELYALLDELDERMDTGVIPALDRLVSDYENNVRILGLHEANNYGKAYVVREKLKCIKMQQKIHSCLVELLNVAKKGPFMTDSIHREALSQLVKIGDEDTANLIRAKFDDALGYEAYLRIKIRNLSRQKMFEYLVDKIKDPAQKTYERIATVEVASDLLDQSEIIKLKQELKNFKKEDALKSKEMKKEIVEAFVRVIKYRGGEKELQGLDEEDLEFLKLEEERVKSMNKSIIDERKAREK